jgi:hypothetical protein
VILRAHAKTKDPSFESSPLALGLADALKVDEGIGRNSDIKHIKHGIIVPFYQPSLKCFLRLRNENLEGNGGHVVRFMTVLKLSSFPKPSLKLRMKKWLLENKKNVQTSENYL